MMATEDLLDPIRVAERRVLDAATKYAFAKNLGLVRSPGGWAADPAWIESKDVVRKEADVLLLYAEDLARAMAGAGSQLGALGPAQIKRLATTARAEADALEAEALEKRAFADALERAIAK